MSLFSFLFRKKNKILRTTHEAETFRALFREDEELYVRVEESDELKRYKELEVYVNSPEFKQRKTETEQLSYKGSKYFEAEKQYKALLKQKKLKSYYLIKESQELEGYERMKNTEVYHEYIKLKTVVNSAGFDKKIHAAEYVAYREITSQPKIAALIKFENLKAFKDYCELKGTVLPAEFEKLSEYVQSEEFRSNREFLLNKNRFQTTDDYKLLCEYEALKKQPDIVKYHALQSNPYFAEMRKWKLVFEDDFATGKLDATKWITRYSAGERFLNDTYGVGNDVQLYTNDNISFNESRVSLNFRKELIVGKYWDSKFGMREKEYGYTSAMISTATSFRQKYGRFEAKVKLNRSAVNSNFVIMGDRNVPFVEIMKCQANGVRVGHAYPSGGGVASNLQLVEKPDLANDFYIFTLEWTEDKMVWMVNDLIVKEERNHLPDTPMYLSFSLGAVENPAGKYVPARFEIDWVKIYKLKE